MNILALISILLACGEKDDSGTIGDGGGADGGGDGGDPEDCWLVRPDECAATPGCMELKAREVQGDGSGGWCVDQGVEGEVVGCMPAEVDCGAAMTYATAPALPDSCFEFTSTCIVAGWVPCTDELMTSPEACP